MTTNDNMLTTTATTTTTPVTFNYFDEQQVTTIQRVCKMFASSDLVPDTYRASNKNPMEKAIANCVIALDIAQRIGANPLAVMQNMAVIYGRPSWSSQFLIATVNTCGRFAPLKYRWIEGGAIGMVGNYDARHLQELICIAYTTAKGSDEVLESSPISLTMAIREGWYTKNGSKWQTMPRQMLMYRAAAFWTRVYAPELSLGMHTTEEVQDIATADYDETTAAAHLAAEKEAHANKEEITVTPLADEQEAAHAAAADSTTVASIFDGLEIHLDDNYPPAAKSNTPIADTQDDDDTPTRNR